MATQFPFSALVGQESMKQALILNAVDPRIGGVLIRGERGTAKSTAARALAALLPPIRVIRGCRFGCDPSKPAAWCSECRERQAWGEELAVTTRPTPFIDLPVSATEDRVVGTLDVEKAIQKGERHFEPGVLAAANRGLLYIDEVNLLDDHVVDVLLDAAAMGENVVEREGISFSHPARFMLVGTMNPEEGDLRPQLLDRFALSVEIRGIRDARQRVDIMQRSLEFERDACGFSQQWAPKEAELSGRIELARQRIGFVTYTKEHLCDITQLTTSFQVDGHRPDLVILKTARAQAALEGRLHLTQEDIAWAAELALPHRLKHTPFQLANAPAGEFRPRIREALGLSKPVTAEDLGVGAFMDEDALRAPYEDETSPYKNLRTGLL
ncbi:MAG TPA: ATP-binding protein [Anaerolineales bacterium]|jgi:Mg-chelatase subunit ChlI